VGLLCEKLRISFSSRVSSVDSLAVLKNQVNKRFFPIMCRAVVYSSLFLCQFKLYFFGRIGEIITQFRDKYFLLKIKTSKRPCFNNNSVFRIVVVQHRYNTTIDY